MHNLKTKNLKTVKAKGFRNLYNHTCLNLSPFKSSQFTQMRTKHQRHSATNVEGKGRN